MNIVFLQSVGSKDEILDLVSKCTQWGVERGIINNPKGTNFVKQRNYLISEAGELADGLNKQNKELIIDAVGDYFVTINGTIKNDDNADKNISLYVDIDESILNEMYVKGSSPESLLFLSMRSAFNGKYATAVIYLRVMCHVLNVKYNTTDYDFVNCVTTAYNVISNRKTELVDGVLISDKKSNVKKK